MNHSDSFKMQRQILHVTPLRALGSLPRLTRLVFSNFPTVLRTRNGE